MRKYYYYFPCITIILLLLTSCAADQERPIENKSETIENTSQSATEQSQLDSWIGNYSFSEIVQPDENMFYELSIYKENNKYYSKINIDGFQTIQRLLANVEGNDESISIIFDQYLPDNLFEVYNQGDILLKLERKQAKLVTNWGKIGPIDKNHMNSGTYFNLDS